MKRPGLTAKQKHFAREQRALLRLRRASVRLTDAVDKQEHELAADLVADLEAAAFAYANTLLARDRRRLGRGGAS